MPPTGTGTALANVEPQPVPLPSSQTQELPARTIWKYPLVIEDEQVIDMPLNSHVLSVGLCGKEKCMWADVNPDPKADQERRIIYIRGTGHPLTGKEGRFIGTIIDSSSPLSNLRNPLVWHVYDGGVL